MTEPCEPHPADRRDLIRERNAPTLVPRRAEHHPLVADDEWERPERLSHRDMRQVYNRRDTGGAGGVECGRKPLKIEHRMHKSAHGRQGDERDQASGCSL